MGADSFRRRRFLLSTTMLVGALTGYGGRAYAACVAGTPPNFICSGANATQQTIAFDDATVSTVPGFSVITLDPRAVSITGDGALSYTDINFSTLTAATTALYVRSTGDVPAGNPGSVAIDTNATLTGGSNGIRAYNNGSGALDVTVNGDVTGTNNYGIIASNSGTDLTVTTAVGTAVIGGVTGIGAGNSGIGALTVTANGDVTGTNRWGIYALNVGTDLGVTTGMGTTVTGGLNGILAVNYGSGASTITANGDVAGTMFYGILARNFGTDLAVNTGVGTTVTGSTMGVRALNYGTEALSITANGDVVGTDQTGIFAYNSASGTDLGVTIGIGTSVTGGLNGILALNDGSGALAVTADGDITGTDSIGIYARNAASGTDLGVTTGAGTAVTGGNYGIRALNYGIGALSVTANGDVTGTNRYGISARNYGTDLDVITGPGATVTGGTLGIYARNEGSGALTVTANGDTSAGFTGIAAQNNNGTDLTLVSNGTVTGNQFGIRARNEGSGTLSVTANGDVTSRDFLAIYARNSANGADLDVTVGAGANITGADLGIIARNYGNDLSVITGAGSTVTGPGYAGIFAENGASGRDLNVTTGTGSDTTGRRFGVQVRNFGSGALSVTANGDVTGTTDIGIYALNTGGGTDLSITTGVGTNVTGGFNGIVARNEGTGAASVSANGDVYGGLFEGIFAENSATGTDLTVMSGAASSITGLANGMNVRNYGSGALTVTANGDVNGIGTTVVGIGLTGVGIYAQNFAGTDLAVTTGASSAVTGSNHGIFARNYGIGALAVTANGETTGDTFDGIYARQGASGTSLTVTTGAGSATTGARYGIAARNYGTGALNVTANGDVTGTNGAGIYARHLVVGGGLIGITVGPGATAAGGTTGVQIAGGGAHSLNNFGTVRNLNGIGGTAILGGAGNETVGNFGLVEGNVFLGTGINAFNNMQSGLFNSGTMVDLGAGNALTNSGALSPGGTGSILTTALTGNFMQTGAGQFLVDIQGANADRVDASGSASVDGKIRPNYTPASLGSNTQWTVLTAATPIVDNGIKAVSTPVVTFGVDFPAPTQMDLVLEGVDFAVGGLNRNEWAIAENFNDIFATGNFKRLNTVMNALATLPTERAIANALDQLSPEIYLDTEIGTLYAALSFTNTLMTCPTYGGANAFIKEGQCVWARVSGRSFTQDRTFETLGIDESSFEVAGGVQGAFGDVWRLGFAGAFEQGRLDTSTNAQSDFDRAHAGAVLKYNPGPLLLAAAVSGGWGWYDTERPIAFPGFSALATSSHDVSYIDGRFRATYLFTNGQWYAKPLVDFDATRIDLDHLAERSTGGVGLNVRGNDETVLSASPALELGVQFRSQGGTLVRPYVRGGATFFDNPDFVLLASFEGSPSGVGPFRIATATDDVVADISAGVDVIAAGGASFRLYYDGRFGDTVDANEAGIKATLPF